VLAGLGLAFLFFLAGMEIDPQRLRGRPLLLGAGGWALSLGLALAVAGGLAALGLAIPVGFVAVALSTTALGTLLPILRDAGVLPTRLGRHTVAAGLCGELFPIILISLLLGGTADRPLTAILLVAFAIVTLGCAVVALRVRPARLIGLLDRSMHATSQLPVRVCVLLLVALVALAEDFGLDVILGAFAAGMVAGLASGANGGSAMLEHKLEAIGFGFLVPVFFIASGVSFDLHALTSDAAALAQVPLFLAALLVVRGVPALLHRHELAPRDRVALALYSSTTLPLVVAITTIAVAGGHMRSATAAALVAAGMLSVLLFPIAALAAAPGRLGTRGPVARPALDAVAQY
jgi:Kef-type K+ transport system membrane component KefB